MHDHTQPLAGLFLMADDLKQEFETRLAETTTLAFRVAYGVLRNSEDAEDVAQEALVKAYRNFRQLRDRDRFRAWLVRVTWRLAIDRLRSDRRREARQMVSLETTNPETPVQTVLEKERAEKLWRAIDALPEKLRIVLVLAGIQEHDVKEVAVLAGLPEGTVKSRLFLARQRLKELLS